VRVREARRGNANFAKRGFGTGQDETDHFRFRMVVLCLAPRLGPSGAEYTGQVKRNPPSKMIFGKGKVILPEIVESFHKPCRRDQRRYFDQVLELSRPANGSGEAPGKP